MTELIEHLDAHPEEWQLWLYRAKWWSRRMPLTSRVCGFVFQGEGGWRREGGNHMAWRQGADTFSAEWPTVRPRPAAEEATETGQIIHAFAFNPPLSFDEGCNLGRWIMEQCNKPYDLWLLSNRALRAVARLRGLPLPVLDFNGSKAFICYEYVARGLTMLARDGLDVHPATFGPPDLWALAESGLLTYRGVVEGA